MGNYDNMPVAVIGIGVQYPNARNLEEFWENLVMKKNCIKTIPKERWDYNDFEESCRYGSFLDEIDLFNPLWLNISPREAELMDPQLRILLTLTAAAIDDAAYTKDKMVKTGVFIGNIHCEYSKLVSDRKLKGVIDMTGQFDLANRLSSIFGFTGPSTVINTACSSSLSAVHAAVNSLRNRECTYAVVGGCNLQLSPDRFMGLSEVGIIGNKEYCTPYGRENGFILGEGAGIIILKLIEDAKRDEDSIYGVIRASAWGHMGDGAFGEINPETVQKMTKELFKKNEIDPASIGLIESGANGVSAQDAAEFNCLNSIFKETGRKIAVSSVKSNYGNMEAASGIAQIVKVLLQMREQVLVPSINAKELNGELDLSGPLKVQQELEPWNEATKRAFINTIGAGGSIVQIICEGYRNINSKDNKRFPCMFPISAPDEKSLMKTARGLLQYMQKNENIVLKDAAYTMQMGREAYRCRLALTAMDQNELMEKLSGYVNGDHKQFHHNKLKAGLIEQQYDPQKTEELLNQGQEDKIMELWSEGYVFDWDYVNSFYNGRRIHFSGMIPAGKKYWLDNSELVIEEQKADSIEMFVKSVFSKILKLPVDKIENNINLKSYGLDSVASVRALNRINELLKIELLPSQLISMETVNDITGHLINTCHMSDRDISGSEDDKKMICFPLSVGQRELYYIYKQHPDTYAYNIPIAFDLISPLEENVLKEALSLTAAKHELLRAVINDKELTFEITQETDIPLYIIENEGNREMTMLQLKRLSHEPFQLAKQRMIRVYFCPGQSVLMFVFHHIIFDGISFSIFLNDFLISYKIALGGMQDSMLNREMGDSYSEFVSWQKNYLNSPKAKQDKEFWLEKMSGEFSPLDIYTGLSANNSLSSVSKSISAEADNVTVKKLNKFSAENNASLFHVLMSAFYILLHRLSGNEDIFVGTPTMTRPKVKLEKTLGYFINMIPLRQKISRGMTFLQLVDSFKKNMLESLDHMYYPYSYIIRTAMENGVNVNSVFDATFHFQSWMSDINNKEGLDDIKIKLIAELHQEGEFPLSMEVYQPSDNEVTLMIKYDIAKYTDTTAAKLLVCYMEILRDISLNPEKKIESINILPEEDIKRMAKWNATDESYPYDKRVCDIFDEVALKYPDNIAIIDRGKEITYKELKELSDNMAVYFYEKGIRRKDYVLFKMMPSYMMVGALLAVMKNGAAYVPVDLDIPQERMQFIAHDVDSRYLICDDVDTCQTYTGLNAIDANNYTEATKSWDSYIEEYNMTDIVYVIYTSGSTGKPKGVEVMHKGLTNVIFGMDKLHDYKTSDCILLMTTLCFDIAMVELYLPLVKGGKMEIAPVSIKRDGILLKEFLSHSCANIIQATPATWKMLMLAGWENKNVKIITAGEALHASLAGQLQNSCKEVWNQYGPTENTIYTTAARIEDSSCITIGKPIINNRIYIFDNYFNLVPIGFAGEMYIGGDCLAKGYLNREELNGKSFIPNPLNPSERLYKTGDLVRFMENGDVDYIGRIDNQVKIRGFRIEIGEIETSIMKDKNIAQCTVIVKNVYENKMLTAFIIMKKGLKAISVKERKESLSRWLPSYMIPVNFVELETFPMTISGKIDKKILELKDEDEIINLYGFKEGGQKSAEKNESLKNPSCPDIEESIKSIAEQVINKQVDINKSLSEYGFDSILFTELSVQINKTLDTNITPIIFYEYLSVKAVSDYLQDKVVLTTTAHRKKTGGKVAIVGISAKMPEADNIDEFWNNLLTGKDVVKEIPIERWDYRDYYGGDKPSKSKWGSFMNDIDLFDNELFEISPREAMYMDPQQRIMLEQTWKCLEDAGYRMKDIEGRNISVFIGSSSNDYSEVCRGEDIDPYLATGISKTIISNRISHAFNFTGPSMTVDTACSSSLVALDFAVQSIIDAESEGAIVGGVNILLSPYTYIALSKNGMLSPDGKCKVFDESADGYVRGEGAVALYIKPLEQAEKDGDHIYAVIAASAKNHCGKTSSLTTPNQRAQAELITETLRKAELTPKDISYFEMHGTGTSLGDPIEVEGIKKVYMQYYPESGYSQIEKVCGLGSIKSNIGHLEGAAGIAGLLKVILSIKNKKLTHNINFKTLNHNIILDGTPFYIVDHVKEWTPVQEGIPLRAGVSSYGFGGQNAHVIVEEYVGPNAPKKTLAPHPMKKIRHWAGGSEKDTLVDENISTISCHRYLKRISGSEFYLADHIINGTKILPGVIYLEMAVQAAERAAGGKKAQRIYSVSWQRPIIHTGGNQDIYIELKQDGEDLFYSVYMQNEVERQISSEGTVSFQEAEKTVTEKIDEIVGRCHQEIDREEIYDYFKDKGVCYGPSFKCIEKILYGKREALSFIRLPKVRQGEPFKCVPSIMDGVLQTVAGIDFNSNRKSNFYPFSVGTLSLYDKLGEYVLCHARIKSASETYIIFDIDVVNEQGIPLLCISDYMMRSDEREPLSESIADRIHQMLESGILTESEANMLKEGIMQ